MSCCARCGQGICTTAGKIALNKVWHKDCFCCYNCGRPLRVNTAKIYYGEVFCSCCCPQVQEAFPLKVCRVSSTPSFNDCCTNMIRPVCCESDEDYPRPRDVHSCSCIPGCCNRYSPCNCQDFDEPCYKRLHRPTSPPKPVNRPPRQQSPCCCCKKCTSKPPRKKPCQDPCKKKRLCINPSPCTEGRRRMICFQPASSSQCKTCCKWPERCRRCGEKVFAAEKVLTANGAYHLSCFSCYCCCKSLCVKTMYEACGEIYCRQCYNNYFGVSGYGYSC